jgi:hypothetical protein
MMEHGGARREHNGNINGTWMDMKEEGPAVKKFIRKLLAVENHDPQQPDKLPW